MLSVELLETLGAICSLEWVRNKCCAIVLFLTGVILPVQLVADEVFLTDGSRLKGTIKKYTETELILETAFAGEITIPADQIEGISSDRRVTVALESGDRIVSRPQYSEATGEQKLRETSFGDVTVDKTSIKGAWEPGKSPEKLALEEMENPWSGRVAGGLNGATGNTERISARARIDLLRDTGSERLRLFAQGKFASEDGDETEREIKGGADLEVDISERWFVFSRLELEHDEFENLDLRTTVTGGFGYFLIREPDQTFKLRGGLGFEHDSYTDGSSESDLVGSLGWDYALDMNEWFGLTNSLTYYPSLTSDPFNDFRVEVDTAVEVPLTRDEAWKLRAGVENDYDNKPQPGIESLDTTYFLSLVYDWD